MVDALYWKGMFTCKYFMLTHIHDLGHDSDFLLDICCCKRGKPLALERHVAHSRHRDIKGACDLLQSICLCET